MATNPTLATELREFYAKEYARLKENFAATREGRSFLTGRTELVDSVARRGWREIISPDPEGPKDFVLIALGGYGRNWLFPYSDIDLLFLHAGDKTEAKIKEPIRRFSQEFWALRLNLSPASRTLGECERLDAENLEFAISLLDCRYLAGDRPLFARLHSVLVPKLVARESQLILTQLAELARSRHAKFGGTLFHLEPNVKDGPGGLRDYNVASWLTLVSAMAKQRAWPDRQAFFASSQRGKLEAALEFLMSVRCF